ncbi:hypothetical protein GCM10009603_04580 [Nocardiopsis exhalans]
MLFDDMWRNPERVRDGYLRTCQGQTGGRLLCPRWTGCAREVRAEAQADWCDGLSSGPDRLRRSSRCGGHVRVRLARLTDRTARHGPTPEEKHIRQLADFIKRGTPGKGVSGNFRWGLWSAAPVELKL